MEVTIPDCTSGKSSWPELKGCNGDEAVEVIKRENPCLKQVFTIPEGTFVTQEYRTDRVRVWVDKNGKVVDAPTIG